LAVEQALVNDVVEIVLARERGFRKARRRKPRAQLLESLLFGVRSTDWPTFAGAAVVLLAIGAAAAYWPARRAARVDPMIALRVE